MFGSLSYWALPTAVIANIPAEAFYDNNYVDEVQNRDSDRTLEIAVKMSWLSFPAHRFFHPSIQAEHKIRGPDFTRLSCPIRQSICSLTTRYFIPYVL